MGRGSVRGSLTENDDTAIARLPPEFRVVRVMRPREQHALAAEQLLRHPPLPLDEGWCPVTARAACARAAVAGLEARRAGAEAGFAQLAARSMLTERHLHLRQGMSTSAPQRLQQSVYLCTVSLAVALPSARPGLSRVPCGQCTARRAAARASAVLSR